MLRKKPFFVRLLTSGLIISIFFSNLAIVTLAETTDETTTLAGVEIREYEGKDLSSIEDFYENSISGPQYINAENYRLFVTGLVDTPRDFTYNEIVNNYQPFKKVVTLYCVEGWNVTILWEGIRLKDLFEDVGVNQNANTVIFLAYDGYSTSVPLDYIIDNNILMAYKMNNVTLPPERGFPFQLVAESKWGYKWIKWITSIRLSDEEDFRGYWESLGYSNDAYLGQSYVDPSIPEFPAWIIAPLFAIMAVIIIICRRKLLQKNG